MQLLHSQWNINYCQLTKKGEKKASGHFSHRLQRHHPIAASPAPLRCLSRAEPSRAEPQRPPACGSAAQQRSLVGGMTRQRHGGQREEDQHPATQLPGQPQVRELCPRGACGGGGGLRGGVETGQRGFWLGCSEPLQQQRFLSALRAAGTCFLVVFLGRVCSHRTELKRCVYCTYGAEVDLLPPHSFFNRPPNPKSLKTALRSGSVAFG